MSKRRATGQLTPAVTAKRHEAIPGDRARLFTARLKSLNQQFAEWVKGQAVSCTTELWVDGVQHYQEYVGDLLEEFKDIVGDDAQLSRQRDVNTPVPDTMFGTPVGAAAAAGGRDNCTAPTTGGSTGRKSVTWADTSSALTPAPAAAAAAANGTPGPNTTNAGHTPAPTGFGRFECSAGTPGGSEMPTPKFTLKQHAASNAGTPASDTAGTPAGQGTRSIFGSAAAEGKGPDAAAAAGGTPVTVGGFAFGVTSGGFGTPVTAEPDKTAKGAGGSSSPPVFAFGTPAASAFGTPAAAGGSAAAADATTDKAASQPRAFTFGTPAAAPAGKESDAAGKDSTPTFGRFGAGSKDASKDSEKDTGKAPSPPAFTFGVPQSEAAAAASSSPAFGFGAASSSGAAAAGGSSAGAGDKGKATAFSFGVSSSSAAAGGTTSTSGTPAAAAAGGSSSGFLLGTPASGAAGGSSSSTPAAGGFNFGASSSGGGAASSSTPSFGFGGSAGAGGADGSGSKPAISFGGTPAISFGAGGTTPTFGTHAGATAVSFGGAAASGANGTAGGFAGFNFLKPSEAAGGAAGAAAAGGAEADGDEAEQQEERTPVQTDSRFNVLFSKQGVLSVALKNDKGTYEWHSKGKGQVSVRIDNSDSRAYVAFNLEGQGKQIVMHAIKPRDKPQVVTPGKGDRVMMGLLNTIYTTKKNEETGLPEPVVKYEMKNCLLRFGAAESVQEFIALVQQHRPQA